MFLDKFKNFFSACKNLFVNLFLLSKEKFLGLSKRNKIITLIAIVLIISLLFFFIFGGKKKENTEKTYIEVQAAIGNITETIEQSGVVEPYERYEITSLVKGEIIASPFEEGDFVNEGDTLYQIDDEDAQLNMEKAQMSLEEANENVANLNIYAPASGKLTDFSLKIGDNVGASVIGKINNTESLAFDVPFSSSDFEKISLGDRVTATSALYMTSIAGKVTYKYSASSDNGYSGSIVRNIEIEIENPGAISEGTTFAATVHTKSGDVSSAGSGVIEGGTTTTVRAEVSGEVSYVGVKNGDYVKKGQLIARLTNRSLVNNQKSSQLNVKSNQKTLDNYNITAPISGTVITKNSKAGDKIDNSNSQTVMMVVADMSKMKFTITVDELDISDISLGQVAYVDADAIPDKTFEARVTTIASEGVSSGDGVTTFTVELTIDEPGELKSGMNVNANILINEAYNVVTIPEDALMSVRGTNASVLVKSDKNKKAESTSDDKKPTFEGNKNFEKGTVPDGNDQSRDSLKGNIPGANAQGAAAPSGNVPRGNGQGAAASSGNIPRGNGQGAAAPSGNGQGTATPNGNIPNSNASKGNFANANKAQGRGLNLPDGYEIRQVVIGISDGTNIEIVSGLSEGETVAYIPTTATSQNRFMMGGMMMGGRMPGASMMGGMSGGMNRTGGNRQTGGMTQRR